MENNQYYNTEKYFAAKKQVEEIKGFYGNLISYFVVNFFLLFINLKYSPDHLWFFWTLLGWGIGVVFHGIRVFNVLPFFGKDWEQKKIAELMEKEKENFK